MTNEEKGKLREVFAAICDLEESAERKLTDSLGSDSNRDNAFYWNGAREALEKARKVIFDSGLI